MGGKAKTDQQEADARGWSMDEWLARKADSAFDKGNKSDNSFNDYYQRGDTSFQQHERDWAKDHPGEAYPTAGATGYMGTHGGGTGGVGNNPPPSTLSPEAQSAAATQAQTKANRPNQVSPFGFNGWTQDANGNWTNTSTLSPVLQSANASVQEQARINALRGVGTGEDARNQAITGAYGQATSRLDPQWHQRDEQLSSTLANQGLDPNSQAYRNAMLQQGQQRNDAYSGAMNGAIAQGTAAQQATFGENMQAQQLPYQQLGALYGLSHPFGFNASGRSETQSPDAAASLAYQKQQRGEELSAEERASLLRAAATTANALQNL